MAVTVAEVDAGGRAPAGRRPGAAPRAIARSARPPCAPAALRRLRAAGLLPWAGTRSRRAKPERQLDSFARARLKARRAPSARHDAPPATETAHAAHGGRARNKVLLGLSVLGAGRADRRARARRLRRRVAATAPNIDSLKPINQGATLGRSTPPTARGSASSSPTSSARRSPRPRSRSSCKQRDRRDRGPALLQAQGRRLRGHRARRRARTSSSGKNAPGRLDDHDAARPQPLHRATRKRDLQAQDPRGQARRGARGRALQDAGSSTSTSTTSPTGPSAGRPRSASQAAARDLLRQAGHATSTLAEAALLAGLPQAPSQYNPFRNPSAALARRNEVLQQMARPLHDHAGQPRRRRSARRSASSRARCYTSAASSYFFDYVQEQLIERYGVNAVRQGGLKVYTTIDPKLQQRGAQGDRRPAQPSPATRRSAIVTIDPRQRLHPGDGLERHLQGPASSTSPPRATASPGSTFKIDGADDRAAQGRRPRTRPTYTSQPARASTWRPATPPGRSRPTRHSYGGNMNLDPGHAQVRQHRLRAARPRPRARRPCAQTAHDMGITTKLDGYPAEGLGGLRLGVSPLEMANAYATLASAAAATSRSRSRKVDVPRRQVRGPRQARAQARVLRRRDLRGHEDPRAERAGGTGTAAEHRLPGGRQDRHHRRLQRRLVRRLHAEALDAGLGRLSRTRWSR